VATFSLRALSQLGDAGLVWLSDVRWPAEHIVPDGEVSGETGSDGIESVLKARRRRGGITCFLAFDILALDGHDVMREPWPVRCKRLEDIGARSNPAMSPSCS
jgi:ATP-dependent DNA ligase